MNSSFFSQFISSTTVPTLAPLAICVCKESQQFVGRVIDHVPIDSKIARQTSIIESRELSDFIKGIRNLLIVCNNAEFAQVSMLSSLNSSSLHIMH